MRLLPGTAHACCFAAAHGEDITQCLSCSSQLCLELGHLKVSCVMHGAAIPDCTPLITGVEDCGTVSGSQPEDERYQASQAHQSTVPAERGKLQHNPEAVPEEGAGTTIHLMQVLCNSVGFSKTVSMRSGKSIWIPWMKVAQPKMSVAWHQARPNFANRCLSNKHPAACR